MVQGGGSAGFPEKLPGRYVAPLGPDELYGNDPFEACVARFPDFTETTGCNSLNEDKRSDLLP